MQEEYLIEKMIKGKSDKERKIELMRTIIETKEMLKIARCNFEYAEDDMIDYYTYQIKAHQSKLDYLIKVAKRRGIEVSRIDELKTRLYIKNNIAGWVNICPNYNIKIVVIYYYYFSCLGWYCEYKYSYSYILYMFDIHYW